ncbi:protein kinase [Nonomuraea sp. NPDC059194]|uniref:serine/threonine-protein kinase n=1 Tax=Nonomuraea sp. NPDC059194 TaxID=3346764 RepID=UPI0036980E23
MSKLGKVGPYTLLERLGRGGMGEVYLASTRRGERVALKVLHDLIEDSASRIRLEREVRALRRVESPYVARVLDADLDCVRPYLVMEHIEGDTLLDHVRRSGPLRGAGLVEVAQGVAAALAIVHAAGVIHRDLKPANILMGVEGPVLIDFGIAQVIDATRLTMTGTFLGTPGYAAPELFADEHVAEPADVHAWAATVAFAATGRPTFGRGTVEAQMYAVLNGQADLKGVPAGLLPLVRAALNREPGKRPTAALLADRLARLARASVATADEDVTALRGRAADAARAARLRADESRVARVRADEARSARARADEARAARVRADDEAKPGRGKGEDAKVVKPRAAEQRSAADDGKPARPRAADDGKVGRTRTPEDGKPGRSRTPEDGKVGRTRTPEDGKVGRGRPSEDSKPGRIRTPEDGKAGRSRVADEAKPGRGRVVEEQKAARGRVTEEPKLVRSRMPGTSRSRTTEEGKAAARAQARVARVRRTRAAQTPAAQTEAAPTTLPAGNAALLLLAVLAVPCVVATVIWPIAGIAITGVFVVLVRTVWIGHWMVRNRTSKRVRVSLRVLLFPFALAGSALTCAGWPGVPVAAAAGGVLWMVAGGELGPDWWQQPAPVTAAGVVFGVLCGAITGREVERAGANLPDLRKEGLRALAVLGGFVAVCAAAVRAIALLL